MTRAVIPAIRRNRGGAFAFARHHVNAIATDDRLDASRVWEFDEFRDFRVESHYADTHGPLNALCRLRGGDRSRYPWTDSQRQPLNFQGASARTACGYRNGSAHKLTRGMPPACFVSCPDLPSRCT